MKSPQQFLKSRYGITKPVRGSIYTGKFLLNAMEEYGKYLTHTKHKETDNRIQWGTFPDQN